MHRIVVRRVSRILTWTKEQLQASGTFYLDQQSQQLIKFNLSICLRYQSNTSFFFNFLKEKRPKSCRQDDLFLDLRILLASWLNHELLRFAPAEWARHARTILAWPGAKIQYDKHDPESVARATKDICSIAEAVSRFEPVTLLVGRERLAEAQKVFAAQSYASSATIKRHEIKIHPVAGDQLDVWMRDIAPTFTVKRDANGSGKDTLCGVDLNFNGWGNKFLTPTSVGITKLVLQDFKIERVPSPFVAEGGALEIDGEGTLMASESSLVNDNRNPGKTRDDVEAELRRTLGVKKFIWVPGQNGIDSTDYHIDALARFTRPGSIFLSKPSDSDPEGGDWSNCYKESYEILSRATDAKGRKLNITQLKEPRLEKVVDDASHFERIHNDWAGRPVHSYVNYLVVNGGVIFPQFGDEETDKAALEAARIAFEGREVVPVMIKELPILGGGIHCVSQEIPLVE